MSERRLGILDEEVTVVTAPGAELLAEAAGSPDDDIERTVVSLDLEKQTFVRSIPSALLVNAETALGIQQGAPETPDFITLKKLIDFYLSREVLMRECIPLDVSGRRRLNERIRMFLSGCVVDLKLQTSSLLSFFTACRNVFKLFPKGMLDDEILTMLGDFIAHPDDVAAVSMRGLEALVAPGINPPPLVSGTIPPPPAVALAMATGKPVPAGPIDIERVDDPTPEWFPDKAAPRSVRAPVSAPATQPGGFGLPAVSAASSSTIEDDPTVSRRPADQVIVFSSVASVPAADARSGARASTQPMPNHADIVVDRGGYALAETIEVPQAAVPTTPSPLQAPAGLAAVPPQPVLAAPVQITSFATAFPPRRLHANVVDPAALDAAKRAALSAPIPPRATPPIAAPDQSAAVRQSTRSKLLLPLSLVLAMGSVGLGVGGGMYIKSRLDRSDDFAEIAPTATASAPPEPSAVPTSVVAPSEPHFDLQDKEVRSRFLHEYTHQLQDQLLRVAQDLHDQKLQNLVEKICATMGQNPEFLRQFEQLAHADEAQFMEGMQNLVNRTAFVTLEKIYNNEALLSQNGLQAEHLQKSLDLLKGLGAMNHTLDADHE